jgi:undecaprenyl-diphosphatase
MTRRDDGSRSRLGGIDHPVSVAVAAAVGLSGSWLLARRDPIPEWELDLTEWINGVPEAVATVLYPVMQLGSLGGPLAVGLLIATIGHDRLLGGATAVAGTVTWFAAKGVKNIVGRGRPLAYLADIDVREGDGSGIGFVSGHSAVAATTAVMAMASLPRRWRWVAAACAVLVGVARIVHGVHLPADIVGGWSLGTLVGLGALSVVDAIDATTRARH